MTATKVAVPDTLEMALSAQWLTAALSQRFRGVQIRSVATGPVVDRIFTNARFTIDCADPVPSGLPTALCVGTALDDHDAMPDSRRT